MINQLKCISKLFSAAVVLTAMIVTSISLLVAQAQAQAPTTPQQITIGFLPNWSSEELKKGSVPMARELQKRLGVPVSVYMAKSYSSLIKAMKDRKVDFAFMSAMSFVEAEKEVQLQVLLKKVWDSPNYHSVLLSLKNSKIEKLADLKGKRVAFVDEKSTSGYLYPLRALRQHGLEKQIISKFSGSHAQSVKWLEDREVDAIAVFADDLQGKKSAWQKFAREKDGVQKIWISEAIPNDPFCVSKDFYDKYPKLTHALMASLIDAYDLLKSQKEVQEVFGAQSFMTATSGQYDSIRRLSYELKQELKDTAKEATKEAVKSKP